jgi:hypothetical protein
MPTREKMILLNIDMEPLNKLPPKIEVTRSKRAMPTSSQFNAPMITSTRASLSNGVLFIDTSPLLFYFYIISPGTYYHSHGWLQIVADPVLSAASLKNTQSAWVDTDSEMASSSMHLPSFWWIQFEEQLIIVMKVPP